MKEEDLPFHHFIKNRFLFLAHFFPSNTCLKYFIVDLNNTQFVCNFTLHNCRNIPLIWIHLLFLSVFRSLSLPVSLSSSLFLSFTLSLHLIFSQKELGQPWGSGLEFIFSWNMLLACNCKFPQSPEQGHFPIHDGFISHYLWEPGPPTTSLFQLEWCANERWNN